MFPLRRSCCLSVFAALFAVTVPTVAFGQAKEPTPLEMAQTLFDKASEEMDQGQYAPACKKLQEVIWLVPEKIDLSCLTIGRKNWDASSLFRTEVRTSRERDADDGRKPQPANEMTGEIR